MHFADAGNTHYAALREAFMFLMYPPGLPQPLHLQPPLMPQFIHPHPHYTQMLPMMHPYAQHQGYGVLMNLAREANQPVVEIIL
jgi:hypothetical protein